MILVTLAFLPIYGVTQDVLVGAQASGQQAAREETRPARTLLVPAPSWTGDAVFPPVALVPGQVDVNTPDDRRSVGSPLDLASIDHPGVPRATRAISPVDVSGLYLVDEWKPTPLRL